MSAFPYLAGLIPAGFGLAAGVLFDGGSVWAGIACATAALGFSVAIMDRNSGRRHP